MIIKTSKMLIKDRTIYSFWMITRVLHLTLDMSLKLMSDLTRRLTIQ